MMKATFFALIVLALVCVMLFATTTLTNGGMVYKTFATHPDTPPSGGLLLWAKTDGTFQTTNSIGTDSGMGGASSGTPLFRAPVAVDDTTGWSDYGSTTGRTIDTSNSGIVIISSAMGTSAKNLQGRVKTATPPFDRIFAILPVFGNDAVDTAQYQTAGVMITDSTGKSVTCGIESYGNRVNVQGFKNTSATVFSAAYTVNPPFTDVGTVNSFPLLSGLTTVFYLRLSDIANVLSCRWSPDGYSWLTVWSHPDNDFLSTPNGVGYFVDANNQSTFKVMMIVRSYEVVQ